MDHDDTVVQSEATVNYPCFCRFLEQYRPGMTISFADYVSDCSKMTFIEMCKTRFSLTEEELKQEYRQVLWLAYFEGFSYKEIAHILRKTTHNIETMAYRARLALKQILIKEGFDYENL